MAVVTKSIEVAGRTVTFESGSVAEQASGAVIVRIGDTVVLSTATMSKPPPGESPTTLGLTGRDRRRFLQRASRRYRVYFC